MVQRIKIKVTHQVNRTKDKNHMIVSMAAEKKILTKIQHLFMMKTLTKLKIARNFLKLIKGIYEKPTADIILNGERRKHPP